MCYPVREYILSDYGELSTDADGFTPLIYNHLLSLRERVMERE